MGRVFYVLLFLFVFLTGPAPAHATSISSGSKTQGSITAGGSQTYTFNGDAGQGLILHGYTPASPVQ